MCLAKPSSLKHWQILSQNGETPNSPPAQVQAELCTMYFDGSLIKTGARVGLLFISPLGVHMRYIMRIHFVTSNNVAEYEALVNGLWIAIELGVRRLDV